MPKYTHYVEGFSMVVRNQANGVNVRYEGRHYVPAVNVKPPRLFHRLPAALQAADQAIIDAAFESVRRVWWSTVPQSLATEHLKPAFPGDEPEAQAAGRSEGWVAVLGIGKPDDWSAKQLAAWAMFERAIAESIVAAELMFQEEIRDRMADGSV